MANKVLKIDRALDDAVVQALVAIEAGRFNKTIKLLEYLVKQEECTKCNQEIIKSMIEHFL